MKRYFLGLSMLVCGCMFSQNLRYYRPGQSFTPADNNCLLIKNDAKTMAALDQIGRYASFKAVKLIGFDGLDYDMDSLFTFFSSSIPASTVIVENCSLSDLNKPLNGLKKLEELQLLNCDFDENSFFPLLKNTALKKLVIQQPYAGLALDSLALLPQLKQLQVSNTKTFSQPNKSENLLITANHTTRHVEISYFGSLYKDARTPAHTAKPVVNAPIDGAKKITGVSLTCISQPVPGVKINDTVYTYNASSPVTFTYQSGSNISVDKNAFVSVGGKTYTGKVQLFYREFRNPVEIMLSGIPMTNMVDGKPQLFRSGGMYEINAYDSKGNELRAKSDTSIKINFALTDTSENFNFYSLSNNGGWTSKQTPLRYSSRKDTLTLATKAVKEYFYFLTRSRQVPDTNRFNERFENDQYLGAFRKDNFLRKRDSIFVYHERYKSRFKIKYCRRTNDGKIVFMIVPIDYYVTPSYIRMLTYRYFIYEGALTKETFKKLFNKKQRLWDLRITAAGERLVFTIKTDTSFLNVTGIPVYLKDNNSYTILSKQSIAMARVFQRRIRREAILFDKNERHSSNNLNNIYGAKNGFASKQFAAFKYCRRYQKGEEPKMDFEAWKKYVAKFPDYDYNGFQYDNQVGNALIKSDLGIKNIDCYLHSGQMEEIFAKYSISPDSLLNEYNAILFKSINTSLLLEKSFIQPGYLSGYYFKQNPNYLVRFSEDGFMQVTKPEELQKLKSRGKVELAYMRQYNVKGLNSKEITKLILD